MSESRNSLFSSELILQRVRDEVNEREEKFRHDRYQDLLFHVHYGVDKQNHHQQEDLDRLREEFLEEKRQRDMLGRFRLGLDDRFLDKIHVIELGVSTDPGRNGEADGLKEDYNAMKAVLIEEGIIQKELTREESGRFLEVTFPAASADRVVIARTRPLVAEDGYIHRQNGDELRVSVDMVKRMGFSIPRGLYEAYNRTDPEMTSEFTLRSIEELLDTRNKHVDPIRTTYYLRTGVLEEKAA